MNRITNTVAAFDASPYRSAPSGVIFAKSAGEVARLLAECNSSAEPVGFRAAGTSLCGQSITQGMQISIMKAFGNYSVENGGAILRAEPAVRGAIANRALAKFGKRFPADPASIAHCTIGGITANNSSGMNSGVALNPYNTIQEAKYILTDGNIINSCPAAPNNIRHVRADLAQALMELRRRTMANTALTNEIKLKFSIKNTIGLPINAFVDYDTPDDIALHLLTGSEGILAFISEMAYSTIPLRQKRFCGLLVFRDLISAVAALEPMKTIDGVFALELMDFNSLQSVRGTFEMSFGSIQLPDGCCAVLFEYSSNSDEEIENIKSRICELIRSFNLVREPIIASNAKEMDAIWQIRNGLLPSLGKNRPKGTAAIIEDVAFPHDCLVDAIKQLRELLDRFGFERSGIYGHGLDGNVHFIIAQEFSSDELIAKYSRFNDELSELILRFRGSLKAEHGTGRAMAEYVPIHWSAEAYSLMQDTKMLFDPRAILNPGVIFPNANTDSRIVIKSYPVLDTEADNCIECGFCESICPSRDITLTPRKRIRLMREIRESADKALMKDFIYSGLETCAGDGLCAMNCPVGINTGNLIKGMRAERNGIASRFVAESIADNFSLAESIAKASIRGGNAIASIIGAKAISGGMKIAEKCARTALPKPIEEMGAPANVPDRSAIDADFVYFPCCVSRMFGAPPNQEKDIIATFLSVATKAGIKIAIPPFISDYCCGMSFQSKGFHSAFAESANKTIEMLAEASNGGSIPIFFDSSSCACTIKNCNDALTDANKALFSRMAIQDSVEFLSEHVLPRLKIANRIERAILHNTCSQTKMNLNAVFRSIAERCAKTVIVPENNGCCGFAGDRGFLFPELTASATRAEAEEVNSFGPAEYYSSNLPCEMGMSHATGCQYLPIVYLLDKVSE